MGALRGGQVYGFIKPHPEPKKHICELPITLFKKHGTLWRCNCGQVYRLGCSGYMGENTTWNIATLDDWTNAGGSMR